MILLTTILQIYLWHENVIQQGLSCSKVALKNSNYYIEREKMRKSDVWIKLSIEYMHYLLNIMFVSLNMADSKIIFCKFFS